MIRFKEFSDAMDAGNLEEVLERDRLKRAASQKSLRQLKGEVGNTSGDKAKANVPASPLRHLIKEMILAEIAKIDARKRIA